MTETSEGLGVETHSPVQGRSLHLVYLGLPPTENHIWIHRRFGGQVYSEKAREFKQGFISAVGDEFLPEIQTFIRGHRTSCVYDARLTFYFVLSDVLNRGWFTVDKKGARGAQSPYKSMDVGNRRKLLEDCVTTVLGTIDDKLNFRLELVKRVDDDAPRVEIVLTEADPRDFGIPDDLYRRM